MLQSAMSVMESVASRRSHHVTLYCDVSTYITCIVTLYVMVYIRTHQVKPNLPFQVLK